jgi:hypothetical protein
MQKYKDQYKRRDIQEDQHSLECTSRLLFLNLPFLSTFNIIIYSAQIELKQGMKHHADKHLGKIINLIC